MPELPEVESFRQLLLPLIGDKLEIQSIGDHPRVMINELVDVTSSDKSYKCTDVLRRGKQICIVLSVGRSVKYMYLHMGMTGRIRVYGKAENWGEMKENTMVGHPDLSETDENSPPKYTYITFSSPKTNYTAYFCDPRKFGSAYLSNELTDLHSLAPDALTCTDLDAIRNRVLPALTNQRLGIKAILLDQKRAVSGVGNWVADEVLYQCCTHPDQTKLVINEAEAIHRKLHEILSTAVQSLENGESYPSHWLFHYRWTGKKSTKDASGRSITFITSGGRTTAIIASIQKLYARNNVLKPSISHDVAGGRVTRINENDSLPEKHGSSGRSTQGGSLKGEKVAVTVEGLEMKSSFSNSKSGRKQSNKRTTTSHDDRQIKKGRKSTNNKPQSISKSVECKVVIRRTSPRLQLTSRNGIPKD
jgi:formamidopyrimidine-DNA glycosylase